MEFEKVIRERTSTRRFKSDPVSDDVLLKILEAGRIAPTAKNVQAQKILVVKSSEGLEKIDRVSPCRYNAPVCLVVCTDLNKSFSHMNHNFCDIDASIVGCHMMLEATNLGVNNIWIGLFDKDALKNEFGLDNNLEPVCIINLGYKSDDCPVNPMHNIKKSLEEMVQFM